MTDDQTFCTVAANVVRVRRVGPGAMETRHGTKHFKPGTKVYIVNDHPGMCQHVDVVGRSRQGKYILVTVAVWWLENFRPTVVYSPAVQRRAREWAPDRCREGTMEWATQQTQVYVSWVEAERRHREKDGKPWVVPDDQQPDHGSSPTSFPLAAESANDREQEE